MEIRWPGALASGVANSVLIEAITCAGRSANGFTASSPEHTQDLRTFSWNKTRLPNPSDAVVGQHAGVQHVSLAAVGLPKEGLQRTESPSKHAERACGKRLWTRCSTSERQPEPATLTARMSAASRSLTASPPRSSWFASASLPPARVSAPPTISPAKPCTTALRLHQYDQRE